MRTQLSGSPRRHLRRSILRVLACTAIFAGCAAGTAAYALTGTIDTRSDRAALTNYNSYLKALLGDAAQASQRDAAFVSSVNSGCRHYLTPAIVKKLKPTPAYNLGVEIGDDLAIRYSSAASGPFGRLARKLSALTWSRSSTVVTIGRYIAAQRGVFALRATNLCADVVKLGEDPSHTPKSTLKFIRRFAAAAASLRTGESALFAVFERYEAKGDGGLIGSIQHRSNRYQGRASSVEGADAQRVRSDIGVPASS